MKLRSSRDEQLFISRFNHFWGTLKLVEDKYQTFSLDPWRRYWIDTYPPLTMWMDGQNRHPSKTGLNFETISEENQEAIFSLYFHIGFCRRRCAYCRQYEIEKIKNPKRSERLREYIDLLKRDIDLSVALFPALRTRTRDVYFGGGTPSLLPPESLGSLLKHLITQVDLSILSPQSTFEINPEDAANDLLELLKIIAIPRISIGVQSFDDTILRSVGRSYSRRHVFQVIEKVAGYGFKSVNLDLINGFPRHQEFKNWKQELECLEPLFMSGAVQSVTIYMLHPFPRTNIPCHPSDAYWQTRNLCFAREYLRDRLDLYEKPIYWFQKEPRDTESALSPTFDVFGYGNSSYSVLGRWLLQNEVSLSSFLTHPRAGSSYEALPVKSFYRLTSEQEQIRALIFAIRSGSFKINETDWDQMSPRFKCCFDELLHDDLLEQQNDHYQLTDTGKIFAHQIPILFFDSEAKKSLDDYLDSRNLSSS